MRASLPFLAVFLVVAIAYFLARAFHVFIRLELLIICGLVGLFLGLGLPGLLLAQLSFGQTILLALCFMGFVSLFLGWLFTRKTFKPKEKIAAGETVFPPVTFVSPEAQLEPVKQAVIIPEAAEKETIEEFTEESSDFEYFALDFVDLENLKNTSYIIEARDFAKEEKASPFAKERLSNFQADFLENTPLLPFEANFLEKQENFLFSKDNLITVAEEANNLAIYTPAAHVAFAREKTSGFAPREVYGIFTLENDNFNFEFSSQGFFQEQAYSLKENEEFARESNLPALKELVSENYALKDQSFAFAEQKNFPLFLQHSKPIFLFNTPEIDMFSIEAAQAVNTLEKAFSILGRETEVAERPGKNRAENFTKELVATEAHCQETDLPYKRLAFVKEKEIQGKEDLDQEALINLKPDKLTKLNLLEEILDFAFLQKENGKFESALQAFKKAYNQNRNAQLAVSLAIEIANIYKNLGEYNLAIDVLEKGKLAASFDEYTRVDFESNINYLRIIKSYLENNGIGFLPYEQIPDKVKEGIEKNFSSWKSSVF